MKGVPNRHVMNYILHPCMENEGLNYTLLQNFFYYVPYSTNILRAINFVDFMDFAVSLQSVKIISATMNGTYSRVAKLCHNP